MKKPYRLGLDVGSNSIGWCVLDLTRPKETQSDSSKLEPCAIRAMGVRIFPDGRDPQSEASLAVDRRGARSQRRRRDRFLYRKKRLMQTLIRYGLMPTDIEGRKHLEIKDPYALRAKGIAEKLEPHELGRALFHLGQRRGFKSNRKTDAKDDDKQATKTGIKQLGEQLETEGFITLGAFLHDQREKGVSVRFRPHPSEKNKNQNAWDFYPSRSMYEEEFEKLWEEQHKHHPKLLHEDARRKIHHHIFWQRDLKPVKPGRCTFEKDEERAPKALPLNQEFRIRQEIANLKIQYSDGRAGELLTPEQREKIFTKLQRQKTMSFDSIRKQLKLEKEDGFNLEDEKRTKLLGDETGTRLADKKSFDKAWWDFPPEKQNEIVNKLLKEEDEEELLRVAREKWGLSDTAAEALANTKLPDGFGALSEKALEKIVPHLREGKNYAEAAEAAGYHHSQLDDGEILGELPYYGIPLERHVGFGSGDSEDSDEKRYGRIANPTVHIGLNQLRQVINALIRLYGPPEEVVIELARELKQSKEKRKEIQSEQSQNQKKNEKRREELQKLFAGDEPGDGLLRIRLWEELGEGTHDRHCIYTGKQISIQKLFSPEVEIEHILPFKRTLDNSFANKTVSFRKANREKGNHSPYEAFHTKPEWDAMLRRAENLPPNKKWRFAADAMERFDAEEGFLERQLVETQYLSRAAKEYLGKICNPNKIYAIPGRLTAMLRGKWGLNSLLDTSDNFKNRDDHRHHAIDAFVVAVTSRSLLQRIAGAADAEAERDRLIEDMPPPYPRFDRADIKQRLKRIIVSHRPDHSVNGKLLDETAYGLIKNPSKPSDHNLVYRKPIESLNANEIERIRDPSLHQEIKERVSLYQNEKDGPQRALKEISESKGIRRIRLTKTQHPAYPIAHGAQKHFEKAYLDAGNHHIDILDTGGKGWIGVGVSMLEACRNPNAEPWRQDYPDARLIMRVHKGDLLCLQNKEGIERVYVVKRLEISSNRLKLCEHNESGNLDQRHKNEDDPFRWLQQTFSQLKKRKCRRVSVNFLGRLNDPYPGTDPKYASAFGRMHRTK
ncbi:MAG: type II CRISPR RNA-guided endonuclease Cas9 [Hyphomicrobiales bacterium]|nr:type II CRISPR RNA-guided endonuclease Cas9 [Hyphomicrobiales bacterium]